MTTQVWKTDSEMERLVGGWWTDGMEVGPKVNTDAHRVDAIHLANEELALRESFIRVYDVRPSLTEPMWFDWLVENIHPVV